MMKTTSLLFNMTIPLLLMSVSFSQDLTDEELSKLAEDPSQLEIFVNDIPKHSKKEKKMIDEYQATLNTVENLTRDAKKMLLKKNYVSALSSIEQAYDLISSNEEVQYLYKLTRFPAVSVLPTRKIFTFNSGQKADIDIFYAAKTNTLDNWVKKWQINIYDKNEILVYRESSTTSLPGSFTWKGQTLNGKKADEGAFSANIIVFSDLNCEVRSENAGFLVNNNPPKVVLDCTNETFLAGKENSIFKIISDEKDNIASWNFEISNVATGQVIKTFKKQGPLPEEINWDGKDDQGKLVASGNSFNVLIKGKDKAGNAWKSNDEIIKSEIKLDIEKAKISFEISSIRFKSGNSDLLPESIPILRMVIDILEKYSDYKVNVIGHTDNVGSAEANRKLSKNRAKAVVNFLRDNTIDTARIFYEGKGESSPIDTNDTAEGRANNRRVEFKMEKIRKKR